MRSIIPSHIVTRRTITFFQIAFLLISLGIFCGIMGLALFVTADDDPGTLVSLAQVTLLFGGVLIGLAGVGFAIRAATIKPDNTLAITVGNHMRDLFDDSYIYIRNLSKRRLGYIDALLIGKPGVLVFRIVGQTGKFLNEGGHWMKANAQGHWKPLSFNPTKEAIDDVQALRRYLVAHGQADIPVYGIVVFVESDPDAHLTLKNPVVPATHMTSLHHRLKQNYLARERIEQRTVEAIVEILSDD
ncbi:MAG: NERD domain-containing protein [Anaerolineaceae bacterium]|nr:MAG: NERD domain-containing protein [Anaerolineaceae bacterium]